MAFSRQLGVIGILGACFTVAVACDDDGDKIANAGEAGAGGDDGGGKAGSGGKSTGGSNNNSAGDGGTATGGTASDAGAAGETVGGAAPLGGRAGEGGTAGGGSGAGAGGDAGSAGDGGGGGAAPLAKCAASCVTDANCEIDGDLTLKCDQATHQCSDPTLVCEEHDDCVAKLAFWFECGSQNDCFDDATRCVNWQGIGYCVPAADPDFGCGPDQARTLPVFGGDGEAVICVSKGPRCGSDGLCFAGCATFGCEGELTCNEDTGLCECAGNDDCAGSGVCGADNLCAECATSADCEGRDDGNEVCFDGKCGCGSAATCPNYGWVGATPVCE